MMIQSPGSGAQQRQRASAQASPVPRATTVLLLFATIVLSLAPIGGFCAIDDTIPLATGWTFSFVGNNPSETFARQQGKAPDPGAAVTIPHTFPRDRSRTPQQGFGWYFRDLAIPDALAGKDLSLEFECTSLLARVFIDGRYAGGNDYAYLPFRVDLPGPPRGGERIRLAVQVDNRLIAGRIPDYKARGWWVYGGLIGKVRLVARPKLRIQDAAIRTRYVAGEAFDLSISLKPAHEHWDSVRLLVFSPERRRICEATLHATDTTIRIGGVHPWTPETPVLYDFELVPIFHGRPGEPLSLRHGFAQLASINGRLLLNGRPCFLKGFGRHDVIGEKGPLIDRQERLRDLAAIKSLGANFLRIAHHPQDREIYELCDSLGILVMDEIPAWKTEATFLGSPAGRQAGAGYMRELIAAHGNYTCICMWSAGNQLASYRSSVADYTAAVAREVRRCDPFRLVTYCSYYYLWDRAYSNVDVIAVNEYFGWELASLGMLGPMLDKIHKEWPGKPVIVSETGAQSKLGFRNPHAKLAGVIGSLVTKDLSEDHQALFLRSHLDTVWSRNRYVDGVVIWAYADYYSYLNKARTPDMPSGLNACGIVTTDRRHKLSFDVVRDRYGKFTY